MASRGLQEARDSAGALVGGVVGRARERVDGARALLEADGGGLDEDAVHALRVSCKRLRAFWQLLTPALGRSRTRPPERALRDAAKTLAGHREAHVARRAIARISARYARDDDERAAMDELFVLVAARWPSGRAAAATAAPLRETFATQRDALSGVADGLADDALAAGLLRSYRRAREEGRRAALHRDDDAWHRCRRWAKYELYQLELVFDDAAESRRQARLARFGEALGRFNDLCNLVALAEAGGARIGARRVLAREARFLHARMEERFARLYGPAETERARGLARSLRRSAQRCRPERGHRRRD